MFLIRYEGSNHYRPSIELLIGFNDRHFILEIMCCLYHWINLYYLGSYAYQWFKSQFYYYYVIVIPLEIRFITLAYRAYGPSHFSSYNYAMRYIEYMFVPNVLQTTLSIVVVCFIWSSGQYCQIGGISYFVVILFS